MSSALEIQSELATELLVRFLREELGQFGFTKAILGLSGGIDSALSAALAARALGPENVLGVMLPHQQSNPTSEAHARLVAEQLQIAHKRVDITPMVDGYLSDHDISDTVRRGNVMARCRMTILYDLSVEWKGLVIGTSNKSEILLGYSTQFGDSAHAVNPIGDLYKTQVFQISKHLGLPIEVIEKAPSADVVEGQTDEDDLGFSYAEADEILYLMVDERYRMNEMLEAGFDGKLVREIARRVIRNQYKRLPPPIAKLSRRTINQDFRYLRDWSS